MFLSPFALVLLFAVVVQMAGDRAQEIEELEDDIDELEDELHDNE